MSKKIKVYIYIRVSTEMQIDGYSLEAQKEIITDYARKNNMVVVGEYIDEGKKGINIAGREQFKQMLEDIKIGKDNVEYVLVFKLSRFGRNAADSLNSLQFMEDYGVGLYSVSENLDSKAGAGKLMVSVMSVVAEIEHDNILIQTMAGREQKAREGKWNGGVAPYGYVLKNGKIEINPMEAGIVKLIFEKYVETRMGVNGIAAWLNGHGYEREIKENRKLKDFTAQFIGTVIDNPIYIGKIAYGRRKTEKIKGKRNEMHVVWKEDYLLHNGDHDAIITEELWEKARMKRESLKGTYERTDQEHVYLLSGIIKCPACGRPMYGVSGQKRKKDGTFYPPYYAYRCRNNQNQTGHLCTWKKSQISCNKIDKTIEKVVFSLVNNEEFCKDVKTKIDKEVNLMEFEKELQESEKRLKQIFGTQRKIEEQLDSLDIDDIHYDKKYESLNRRLTATFDLIIKTENEVKDAKNRVNNIKQQEFSKDMVFRILNKFNELYDEMSEQDKASVFRGIIESIELYPEKQEDGLWVKSMKLKFPIDYNGAITEEIFLPFKTLDETNNDLGRKYSHHYFYIEVNLEKIGRFHSHVTYADIINYVDKNFGLRVTPLYIAEVKRLLGVTERKNYNLGHGKSITFKCPQKKKEAIIEALKYFGTF